MPDEATTPTGVTAHARDVALGMSLLGIVAIAVASFFSYPLYESGVAVTMQILSNVVSFLLGMKAALASPDPPK